MQRNVLKLTLRLSTESALKHLHKRILKAGPATLLGLALYAATRASTSSSHCQAHLFGRAACCFIKGKRKPGECKLEESKLWR